MQSFLLGDFHVCLTKCLGNSLLADTLRDFTARTTLIAMLYQSSHDATHSCAEHVEIVRALEKSDWTRAEQLMQSRIGQVKAALKLKPASGDALDELRQALKPLDTTPTTAARPAAQDLLTSFTDKPSDDASTYLGALL